MEREGESEREGEGERKKDTGNQQKEKLLKKRNKNAS